MKRQFGTAGIRGLYGLEITEELAEHIGSVVGTLFKGSCLIARDTRPSGESLALSVIKGLSKAECEYHYAGILPTPAVAALVNEFGYSCGIMITASHNPVEYNGIKIFKENGLLLNTEEEKRIEHLLRYAYLPTSKEIELPPKDPKYYSHYLKHLTTDPYIDLSNLRICIDSAYGATGEIAKSAFEACGASVTVLSEGIPSLINHQCGATHPEAILEWMKSRIYDSFDLGFAFDGDGDRVVTIYNNKVLDGDSVIYNLSLHYPMTSNSVVGTIVNNSALEDKLLSENKSLIRTPVGGKYMLAEMIKGAHSLGGEQCGHYMFSPKSLTSDGLHAALLISHIFKSNNKSLKLLDLYHQKSISIPCKSELLDNQYIKYLIEVSKSICKSFSLRMSGTEPVVRITAESSIESVVDSTLTLFNHLLTNLTLPKESEKA